MRVTLDRRLCAGSLSFCERCWVQRIISAEGQDTLTLAPADAQAVALDGWPHAKRVKFEPDFYRA